MGSRNVDQIKSISKIIWSDLPVKSSIIDSEILMSKVLKKTREYILLYSNKDISTAEFDNFKHLINERTNGKPIAYLIGKKFFWKWKFIFIYLL